MTPPTITTLKTVGISVVAVLVFSAGYMTHKWFTKPVTQVVVHNITADVGPPVQNSTPPVVNNGVVNPGVHFVHTSEQPKPPSSSIPPLPQPSQTTVVTVQVPTPMKLQVFHQSEIKWARTGNSYNIWDEGRIWTRDEKGQVLEGITADTTYSNDASLNLPISETVTCPAERVWGAGILYNITPKGYGVCIDRDIAFIRVGTEVTRIVDPPAGSPFWNVAAKVEFRF